MVHMQIPHDSADLTAPAIALENLAVQFLVRFDVESNPRLLWSVSVHDARPPISDRKAFC